MSFPGFKPSVGLTSLEIKSDPDPKHGTGAPASRSFARPPLPLTLLWPQRPFTSSNHPRPLLHQGLHVLIPCPHFAPPSPIHFSDLS